MHISRQRRALSIAALSMTLPYLMLKLMWLSGSRIGLIDPTFGRSTSMHLLNGATVVLDVAALCLAATFGTRRGQGVPAFLVVPPMWVGAGLLGQVLVLVGAFAIHHPPVESTTGTAPMATWVFFAVYADFCGLGMCLLPAFALYARDRWMHIHCNGGAARILQVGCAVAAATAAVNICLVATGTVALINSRLVDTIVLLAAVGGVQAFRRRGRRPALVVAFVATGACVAWSCYALVLTFLPNELAQTERISNLDTALAVAKLVAGALLTAVLVRMTRVDTATVADDVLVAEPFAQRRLS